MSKTYLITLTPTGKFFFGGNMKFTVGANERPKNWDKMSDEEKKRVDKEIKNNTRYSSYIIKSEKYPQQTSLLGMLRFLILRNAPNVFNTENQKITNPREAEKLIGTESFRMGKTDGYGKIEKLYPCFIQKDGEPIQYLEQDYKYKILFANSKGHTNMKMAFDIPEIIGYNAKDGIPTLYLIDNVEVPEDDIFIKDISNGINRDIDTGKVEDNAYFKQVCYRFNDKLYEYEKNEKKNSWERVKDSKGKKVKYSFAFYADLEISDEELKKYNNQLVSLGGDNSQFIIEIKPGERKKKDGHGNCVVLESPAYLYPDEIRNVRFAIANTIPFKCMKTETSNVQAYNIGRHRYDYSEEINLYNRGSVFYFQNEEDANDFTNILKGSDIEAKDNNDKSHADFYQIGYNHFFVK